MKTPVIIFSGFLGAGKTTLLKQPLRRNQQQPDGVYSKTWRELNENMAFATMSRHHESNLNSAI
jgi:tRNA A37 threonylcarbamoyladenosine biosynthesis protein TsaE